MGKGYAYGFLSTVVEDHHRLIGLWVAIYCRGLWLLESLMGRFGYHSVPMSKGVYIPKSVSKYTGRCMDVGR